MLGTNFSPWPSYTEEEANKVKDILLSNKVNYWTGTECREFEKEFAEYTSCNYAITVANGTVALDLALIALGIGAGDEVIVTPRTFIASTSSIVNAGAIPIFADVCPDSQNITPETIKNVLSPKTKAIICVHLAGWPCDMDPIMALAQQHKLLVIEDCAQAHGAEYKGRPIGSIGDIGCFSFCQDKIMSTGGEGGMVTTNNQDYWDFMWSYKDHGKSYNKIYHDEHPPGFRWLHSRFGTNWRMTEMQAVIGRYQLKQLKQWNTTRNHYQSMIWDTASNLSGLRVPQLFCANCDRICNRSTMYTTEQPSKDTLPCLHAAYKCYVFVETDQLKSGWDRDKIIEEITNLGVPCFSGSCSEVYLEEAFTESGLCPTERLPVARKLGETSLMFLVHPTLSESEILLTCQAINIVMEQASTQIQLKFG